MPENKFQNSTNEKILIERCKKGDLDAFNQLILKHQDHVYNLALSLLKNPEDALDLAQEVFCSFYRNIRSFRGRSRLSTWLYRITINMAKNLWKRRERRGYSKTVSLEEKNRGNKNENLPLQIADNNPGPRKEAAGRELMERLREKMTELSPEHRQILYLRYTEHLSYEEIATITESSLGTVKSRLNRARTELKNLMEPYV